VQHRLVAGPNRPERTSETPVPYVKVIEGSE